MNLTLLPITALLFLLSGVSVPAHANGRMGKVAIMGLLRGCDAARGHAHAAVDAPQGGWRKATANRGGLSLAGWRGHHAELAWCGAVASGRVLDRKQYRTRFGFAEGAYLAVGPPASRARTGRGWNQSA